MGQLFKIIGCIIYFSFTFMSDLKAQKVSVQKKSSKWAWNIKGGYNIAQFRPFKPLPDTISRNVRRKMGFLAGISVNHQFTDIFSAELGAFYAGKGASFGFPNGDNLIFPENERPILFQLDYIEMPLLAKFRLPQRKLYLSSFAGIVPSYLIASKLILPQVNHKLGAITYEVINWDETYHFDLGISVGAGLQLKVGRGQFILVDLHYTMGTRNIASTTENGRNEVWGIMIGFGF